MRYSGLLFAMIFATVFGTIYLGTAAGPKASQASSNQDGLKTATFAGGCFWCTESDFEKVDGVIEVVSGYTGGKQTDPTYGEVSAGTTGHAEAVQVHYDPERISYEALLEVFWRKFDPTDAGGQFVDRGRQYRGAIFYHDEEQKALAEASRDRLAASGRFDKPIVTEISALTTFYPAEEYHQDYYKKNPIRYKFYRYNSGRDQFLDKIWGAQAPPAAPVEMAAKRYTKPQDEVLKERLTPLQYRVTQHDGTEPPFNNTHWDNQRAGIYVDIVSGEPLFSSRDKFKSGTGWPSFTRPLVAQNVVAKEDRSHFMVRTEVRSRHGDSHLGHLFEDGPQPTGLRYCINSASLRFVPVEDLKEEGYAEFASSFEE